MDSSRCPPDTARLGDERCFSLDAPGFPAALRSIPDPPAVLFARGALAEQMARDACALAPAIAVVGARDATAYGLAVARELGRTLASRGVLVVSGLAAGIDGAAHRGALEAGGRTVAVVGGGTDVVYPREHGLLREGILRRGVILAEQPAGTRPLRHHFPARNRMISGLSLGVVVVEATLRSGSLVTARHALEQGREVFAVPGPVGSPRSRGPHHLLKQGARLVETADDVFAELPVLEAALPPPAAGRHAEQERLDEILGLLRCGATTVDELVERSGMEVQAILAHLLDLELAGQVARGAAGRYAPVALAAPRACHDATRQG